MEEPSSQRPSAAFITAERSKSGPRAVETLEGACLWDAKPTTVDLCLAAVCCQEIDERDVIVERMLGDNAGLQPSLFQRCLLCKCQPETRVSNGIEVHRCCRG